MKVSPLSDEFGHRGEEQAFLAPLSHCKKLLADRLSSSYARGRSVSGFYKVMAVALLLPHAGIARGNDHPSAAATPIGHDPAPTPTASTESSDVRRLRTGP